METSRKLNVSQNGEIHVGVTRSMNIEVPLDWDLNQIRAYAETLFTVLQPDWEDSPLPQDETIDHVIEDDADQIEVETGECTGYRTISWEMGHQILAEVSEDAAWAEATYPQVLASITEQKQHDWKGEGF